MVTAFWFIGITAVVGSVCYLLMRPLAVAYWEQWQRDRADAQRAEFRARREKALREEAVTRVLEQIADYDDHSRRAA